MSSPILEYNVMPTIPTDPLATTESGSSSITNGATSKSITFGVPKTSANYAFDRLYVFNTTDPDAMVLVPFVTARTVNGFTVDLGGTADSGNYSLVWKVSL